MTSLETAQHLRAAYPVPSRAYYNDNDPGASAWLRELMAAGLIMEGTIDERSITEVTPDDLRGFTRCHFFAGIAGWDLALQHAGWPADRPVWTASCPCQPLSCAGQRKGHADERHLWPAVYALVAECRPATLIGEQVASTDGREWLAGIRADLEGSGYAVGAADLCAAGVGAPHRRQRLFWVAHAAGGQREQLGGPQGHAVQRPADDRPTDRMAHAEHDDGRPDQPGRRPQGREADGRAGAVDDAAGSRRHGPEQASEGDSRHQARLRLPVPAVGTHWSDYTTVLCRDNKTRCFERQPATLDDGVPALLDALRRAGASQAEVTAAVETFPLSQNQPVRVSLLRGYGNSIVVQLAAEFIRAIP